MGNNKIYKKRIKKPRYFIGSLARGLSILNTFCQNEPNLSLSEIASANGLTMATASRYLLTMKELGYLVQDVQTKKYLPSPKILSLGFSLLKNMNLRKRILPYMMELTKELNVTTQCAVLDGPEIIYIERIRSNDVVNLDLTSGSRLPAYCTALGKAILAFLDPLEVEGILSRMNFFAHTPYTITNKEVLKKDLEAVRSRGYAINKEELTLGLCTFAAPIFKFGKVEASFGLSFPCYRLRDKKAVKKFITRMLEIAQKVSIY